MQPGTPNLVPELRWLVSGGANDRAHASIAAGNPASPGSGPQAELWPVLVLDSGGQPVQMRTYGYSFPNGRPAEGQWRASCLDLGDTRLASEAAMPG